VPAADLRRAARGHPAADDARARGADHAGQSYPSSR
jgi:hypothetical protein